MRTTENILNFLMTNVPSGRYLIYGAGIFGQILAKRLLDRPDVILVGFIDRNAPEIKNVADLVVILPERAIDFITERVLVFHPTEENNMARRLLASGLTEDHLLRSFSNLDADDWIKNIDVAPELMMWSKIAGINPPDRGVDYPSCEWIEAGLAIMTDSLKACCIGPPS